MDDKDLNFKKEKLTQKEQILKETEDFLLPQLILRISEFNYLQEQLMAKWDENKSNRLEKLQGEIKNLNLKIEYEKREISKWQKESKDFEKLVEKIKLMEFKNKLKSINKKFNQQ